MTLKEATEKAGPGAIRRRSWGEEYAIRYMAKGWVNVKSSDDKHPEGERAYITITDALELDWEVVQDEVIEVGDIVQGPCDKEGEVLGVECEVLKHGKILTRLGLLGENSICCCNKYLTKDLTLIRKGPKKTVCEFTGCDVLFASRPDRIAEVCESLEKDKAYKLTLEEME